MRSNYDKLKLKLKINEIYKIFKFRTPMAIYSLFEFSKRPGKETLLLTPRISDNLTLRTAKIWNIVRQKFSIDNFSIASSYVKNSLKSAIFTVQKLGQPEEWKKEINNLIQSYNSAPNFRPITV